MRGWRETRENEGMNEGEEREKCGGGRRILAGNWGRGRVSQIRLGGCTDRASTSLAMVVMQALSVARIWPDGGGH